MGFVAVLAALFLCACVSIGVGRSFSPFGTLHYNSNAILSPPRLGMRVVLGPVGLDTDDMQLVMHPYHPEPENFPDQFVYDWSLRTSPAGVEVVAGTVGMSHDEYNRDPDRPPVAIVPLDGITGQHTLTIAPRGVQDWPDVEAYFTRVSPKREVAFILAQIFGGVFLALLPVAVRRHVLAMRAWRRLCASGAAASGHSASQSASS